MTEEETMEISETFSALAQLDERDTAVKESVVAYLMWHSGEILDKSVYPNRADRASRIDDLGQEAIERSNDTNKVRADSRRVLAAHSIATQAREARDQNPNTIVCYLDAEMILSEAMIPSLNLDQDSFTLELPEEMAEVGFSFVDFADFRSKYNNLGYYLITDPMTVMYMLEHLQSLFLEKAITNYNQLSTFHTIVPHWNIVGAPRDCERSFENLSLTYDTGKTIKIQGQVSEVGDAMSVYTQIAFRCRNYLVYDGETSDRRCNQINMIPQLAEEGTIIKPVECWSCSGKKDFVRLDSEKSRIEPVQRIQLQELNISEEPKSIVVELRGNLVKQVTAGSTIEITGILRLESVNKNSLLQLQYILGQSISTISDDSFVTVVDETDEAIIEDWIVETPSLEDRITAVHKAWIGHLLCDEKLKQALVLQAVGAPSDDGFGHRSGIHIMIAGDPGTAKTHLLKAMPRISNGSRYVAADNLSQAGLTGACMQVEDLYTGKKRWSIVPGALALTPKESVCCVDEFNLYKHDFGDFNNAMESGMTTINKIVKGTVYTECSVLAGANPNAGVKKKFARDQDFVSQLDLDVTVLQRFDAIFILLDDAKAQRDEDIALSMLGYGSDKRDDIVDLDFIKKYIAHAKTIQPLLTIEAAKYMAKQHSKKRQESKDSDYFRSHRQVASLKRFSLAVARFDLSETVEVKHVMFAETILEATLSEQDPGVMVGAQPKESREFRSLVARKVIEYLKEKNQYENIDPEFIHHWMTENDFSIDKAVLTSMLESFSKNKETKLRKNSNGTYEYDGSQNPAYSMW